MLASGRVHTCWYYYYYYYYYYHHYYYCYNFYYYYLVVIGLIIQLYKAAPDGCQHRLLNPAGAKAPLYEGASADMLLYDTIDIKSLL